MLEGKRVLRQAFKDLERQLPHTTVSDRTLPSDLI